MLFSNFTRTYEAHRTREFSAYEFWDVSAWKIAELMRQYFNEWGKNFVDDKEFVSRFKSKADYHHYSASFELLFYSLLKKSGLELEKHPYTGTLKRPDFGIQTEDGNVFYLECTLSSNSFQTPKERNQEDTVVDIIEKIEYFPYFINLSFNQKSDASISKRKLLKFIDEIKVISEGKSNERLFHNRHLFTDNGWEIEISLLRKTNPDIKRSLGYITQEARVIETNKPILTALKDKKASRYGISSHPYIICLNTSDLFTKEECFSEALFGQYGSDRIDLDYSYGDGFFLADKRPVNTSVSAVIIFRNLNAFTLGGASASLWHNPFARHPIPHHMFPFDEYLFEKQDNFLLRKTMQKEKDFFALLEVDKEIYSHAKENTNAS